MSLPLVTSMPPSNAPNRYSENEGGAELIPSAAEATADEQRQQQDYPLCRGGGGNDFGGSGEVRSGGGGRMDVLGTTIEVIRDDRMAAGGNSKHRHPESYLPDPAAPVVPLSGSSVSVREDVVRARERRRASLNKLYVRRGSLGSLGSLSAASSGGMGGGSARGSLCSGVVRRSIAARRSVASNRGDDRSTRKQDDDADDDDDDDALIDDFMKALGISEDAGDNGGHKEDYEERSIEEDGEEERPIADDGRRSNRHRPSSSSSSTSANTPPHDRKGLALQSSLSSSSVLQRRSESRRASLQQQKRPSSSASSLVRRRGSVGSDHHISPGERKESILKDFKKLEADLANLPLVVNDDDDEGVASSLKSKRGETNDKAPAQDHSPTKNSAQGQGRRHSSSKMYLDGRRMSQLTLMSVDETAMIDNDNEGDCDGYIFDDDPGQGDSPPGMVFHVERSTSDASLPELVTCGVGGCGDGDSTTTPGSSRRASNSALAGRRRSSAALSRGSSLKSTLMDSFRSLTESLEEIVGDISDGDEVGGDKDGLHDNREGSEGYELLQGFPTRLQGGDSGGDFCEKEEDSGLLQDFSPTFVRGTERGGDVRSIAADA